MKTGTVELYQWCTVCGKRLLSLLVGSASMIIRLGAFFFLKELNFKIINLVFSRIAKISGFAHGDKLLGTPTESRTEKL